MGFSIITNHFVEITIYGNHHILNIGSLVTTVSTHQHPPPTLVSRLAPEALPAAEERQKEAERQRMAGNEMSRWLH